VYKFVYFLELAL